MHEPRCIRYFSEKKKAFLARDLLNSKGFDAEVMENNIGPFTLDRFGMPLRFRLYVERKDINKIAQILAMQLRK